MIILKKATSDDYKFLYKLLEEKEPYQNISHKELPTYEDHIRFNEAGPYKEDYIIYVDEDKVGRIYVTKLDEIGIAILKDYQGHAIGSFALGEILKSGKTYLANIAPTNKGSQRFFERNGFKLIQLTYKK